MLLEDAWTYFILNLEQLNKSKYTIKQYRIDGKQFIKYVEEEYQQDYLIEQENFQQVCTEYIRKLPDKFGKNSANRKISSLKSFIRYASLREWIPFDFSELLERYDKEIKELDYITDKEIATLYQHWEQQLSIEKSAAFRWLDLRNYLILHFFAEFGLKSQELIDLRCGNIRDEHLYISENRVFPIPKQTLKVLNMYQAETAKMFDTGHFFSPLWYGIGNKQGEPITERTIERLCEDFSEIIERKITSIHFRYWKIHKTKLSLQSSKTSTSLLGYAQSSVYWERLNRINADKKPTSFY